MDAIEYRTVLFVIIIKGFEQSQNGDATFMLYLVTHRVEKNWKAGRAKVRQCVPDYKVPEAVSKVGIKGSVNTLGEGSTNR
ncbi:MAG: hypothetical protein IPM98_16695 [Lewinellaceae bacterium]|nr:hypothetical protein [Lewinellaceae bacterium]